jgi:hypothetical protein
LRNIGATEAADAAYEQRLLARQRERWFALFKGQPCRSRAQIGARVLYPMLRFLGYPYEELDVDLRNRLFAELSPAAFN